MGGGAAGQSGLFLQMRIVLDAGRGLDWTVANMKTKILAAFAGIGMVLLATGCIHTVSGTKSAAMSLGEDRFAGRYKRSPEQVYQASVSVMNNNGVLITEYIPHDSTNSVRSLYGKVNARKVWIASSRWTRSHRSDGGGPHHDGFQDQDLMMNWKRKSPCNYRRCGEPYFSPIFCS